LKIPTYLLAEVVALMIGIWRFTRLPDRSFKALVFFLVFVVCVEWYGLIAGVKLRNATGWVFNFSLPLEYMFYVWFLAAHLRSPLNVQLSRVYILSFAVFALLYNVLATQNGFHGIYLKIGILGLLFFCSLYFVELLKQDQIVNPVAIPVFWICCGLFIFNLGEFVYGFGISKLAKDPKAWRAIFKALNSNLNIVLYSCISVAFLISSWRK
jgi:hypothetical protein